MTNATYIVRVVGPMGGGRYWLAESAGNVHLTTASAEAREYLTRTAADRTAALHRAHARAVAEANAAHLKPLDRLAVLERTALTYIVEEITE